MTSLLLLLSLVVVLAFTLLFLIIHSSLSLPDDPVNKAAATFFAKNKSIDKMICASNTRGIGHSRRFFKGAPVNGKYITCLKTAAAVAVQEVLDKPSILGIPGRAIIVDVGDTLVWTATNEPLLPIVKLVNAAKSRGYIIIVLDEGDSSEHLFNAAVSAGILPDKTFAVPSGTSKADFRNMLEQTTNESIVMTVGDQWSDVTGTRDTIGIKLPDHNDLNAYFYYNKSIRVINRL